MRSVTALVVHCSANKPTQDIGFAEIDKIHRGRGWAGIGYHFVIRRSGALEFGRPIDEPGAHVEGYNKSTVGICLVGGLDAHGQACHAFGDAYTSAQERTLLQLLRLLRQLYPRADILGHRDFPNVAKSCPCFSVRDWTRQRGLDQGRAGTPGPVPA